MHRQGEEVMVKVLLKKIFSTCHQQQAGEIKIYY
jgi:hypothetical protein